MKKEVGTIDATPSKRLFLSIIADYDLTKAICELIDNALDVWVRNGQKQKIVINILIDIDQQFIEVQDNCGGIPKSELKYIVGPGHTTNSPDSTTIGIFGVGTKRAVVALAQEIKIATRHNNNPTYQVDIDDNWLGTDDWEIPVYEIDDLKANTTTIKLHRLRFILNSESIKHVCEHLGATYARFIADKIIKIEVNGSPIQAITFNSWSFPPKYPPQRYTGELVTKDSKKIKVEVLAGLSRESSPATGEYGVYFYCNDRLVCRGLKSMEVGFTKGLAGQPHPKVSLTRVIVSLHGEAASMPWNSSKSGLNTNNAVFIALRDWLVQVVKDYATLSRIWMGEWHEKVFPFTEGEVKNVQIDNFPEARKSYLPPFPKSRPRYNDVVINLNKKVSKQKPWTRGLYEGIIAADLISKHKLEQRNRIALIVLDSTLEISFKEYLVNDSGKYYTDTQLLQLFSQRHLVHNEMQKHIKLRPATWKKIMHFYSLRCKLVHERASAGISDMQIQDYRSVVEYVVGPEKHEKWL